jgi:TctA family transporter
MLLGAVLGFSLLGTILGAAAGLVPGLHINNLAYMLGASAGALSGAALGLLSPHGAGPGEALLLVAAVLVSCLVSHTMTSILPSVFLGAPDPGLALSVLPAHRLLLGGRGLEAVRCSLTGCVGGLAACLLALPLFRVVMGDPVDAYEKLRPILPAILVLVAVLLVASEPADLHRGRRCVLILDRVREASLALSGTEAVHPSRSNGEAGREATPSSLPLAPCASRLAPCPIPIRPWQAPDHPGASVVVAGVISERRERRGRLSFVLEEGSALDLLVPDGMNAEADGLRVGAIVIAEGRVAPAARPSAGLRRRALAACLFLASGFLGLLVLESGRPPAANWYPLGAPPVPDAVMMFPLFCGLFGLPTLLLGIFESPAAPPQRDVARPLPLKNRLRGILTGSLVGALLGWYPGMTAGHGAVLARLAGGRGDAGGPEEGPDDLDGSAGDATREFLVCAASVTVANAFFNIVALFVILRARSGALHVTRQVLGPGLERWETAASVPPAFALLAVSAALAALLAAPLTLMLGKRFSRLFDRVPYRRLLLGVLALLVAMLFLFSGPAGLAVCAVAACLGTVPPLAGVRRVHLMGAILLPVIVYFLGAGTAVMAFLGL